MVERRQRAQRAALASLAAVPLPASLATFFGAGAAGTGVAAGGAGIGTKIAAVLAGSLIITGAARETIQVVGPRESAPSAARSVPGDRLSSGPRTERRERGVRLPPRRADLPAAPRRADPRPSRRGYAGPSEKTRNPADGEDRGSVGTMLHPTLQLPAPTQDTLQGADRPVQGSPVALRLP